MGSSGPIRSQICRFQCSAPRNRSRSLPNPQSGRSLPRRVRANWQDCEEPVKHLDRPNICAIVQSAPQSRSLAQILQKGCVVSKGYFVWNDLMTSDLAAVLPFYQGLLGWTTDTSDMGAGPYTMFKAGDKHIGGVTPGHQGQPYWVSYISVDDVDAACKQIESLGGRIMGEPLDVPGVGTMAYAADPNGAVFSPFQDSNPDYQPELPQGVQPGGAIAWHEVTTPDQKATDDFYAAVFNWDPIVWPMGEGNEYHGL